MTERPDKQRRAEMLAQQKSLERANARRQFPASSLQIREYFDMLDHELPRQGCDHSLRMTKAWISANHLQENPFLNWLHENGAHCDCEALANAEQRFQDANVDVDWD
jgi:hypothetical protein